MDDAADEDDGDHSEQPDSAAAEHDQDLREFCLLTHELHLSRVNVNVLVHHMCLRSKHRHWVSNTHAYSSVLKDFN